MRLIDADALIQEAYRIVTETNNEAIHIDCIVDELVGNAPTVDAVPVVRCKDCMRRGTTDCPMLEAFNSYPFYEPEDDTFCSYGVACHTMKTVSQMMNEPKIKTHFARIVVCGTEQNPYYNILYYDPSDKEYHIGWGSYNLSYVRQWFAEEFEITPGMNEPVVHGQWEDGVCTYCGFDLRELTDGENDLEQWVWDDGFPYCPNCGAKMDGGDEE